MDDQLKLSTQTEVDIAAQAVKLMEKGARGRELAASLIYRQLGFRIMRSLIRQGAPEAQAEELMFSIIHKFVTSKPSGTQAKSAVALLWKIAKSELTDWVRKKNALIRGGGAEGGGMETSLNDDTWQTLLDTEHRTFDLPGWVKNCVHRASARFQHDNPRQAEVLLLHAQGYSHRELAYIQETGLDGAIQDTDLEKITTQQENAAKARVHHARQLAQEYFKECKE